MKSIWNTMVNRIPSKLSFQILYIQWISQIVFSSIHHYVNALPNWKVCKGDIPSLRLLFESNIAMKLTRHECFGLLPRQTQPRRFDVTGSCILLTWSEALHGQNAVSDLPIVVIIGGYPEHGQLWHDHLHQCKTNIQHFKATRYFWWILFFFFLDLQKVQEIIRKHHQTSCNCLEWHIVMQYCPMANYHYVHVHNLWQSVRGTPNILCFGYFMKMEAFRSELLTGH